MTGRASPFFPFLPGLRPLFPIEVPLLFRSYASYFFASRTKHILFLEQGWRETWCVMHLFVIPEGGPWEFMVLCPGQKGRRSAQGCSLTVNSLEGRNGHTTSHFQSQDALHPKRAFKSSPLFNFDGLVLSMGFLSGLCSVGFFSFHSQKKRGDSTGLSSHEETNPAVATNIRDLLFRDKTKKIRSMQ